MSIELPPDEDDFEDDFDEFAEFDDDEEVPLLDESERMPEAWLELLCKIGGQQAANLRAPDEADLFRIGRYEIEEYVGHGGMGVVVRGRDPELERPIAMKLCLAVKAGVEESLLREARMLAKLDHPHIVSVYDAGRYEGHLFVVMELVDGEDAWKWSRRWVDLAEVRRVYVAAARGLGAAHEAGVIHGDFKASNVLVGVDQRVLVADFGVAELLGGPVSEDGEEDEDGLRRPRAGTLAYMAPERLRGERGDGRSDQYSLCASMWQTLHASRPFLGENAVELHEAMLLGEVRRGTDALAGVPAWLDQVLLRGLSLDPGARFESMEALAEALLHEEESEGGDDEGGGGGAGEGWRGRSGFLHGIFVGASMLAAFGVVLAGLWGTASRPEVGELVPEVVMDSPVDVALRYIEEGRYEDAQGLWLAELGRRQTQGEPYADAAVEIARGFLSLANEKLDQAPSSSSKLATYAADAAMVAGERFWELGEDGAKADALRDRAHAIQKQAQAKSKEDQSSKQSTVPSSFEAPPKQNTL